MQHRGEEEVGWARMVGGGHGDGDDEEATEHQHYGRNRDYAVLLEENASEIGQVVAGGWSWVEFHRIIISMPNCAPTII